MKALEIIVCIKQVPDVREVSVDPETNALVRDGVASIMNPPDRHALEEAVSLKERFGGTVTSLSMGPPQAEEILKEAISCGADKGVLVSDRAFAGSDTMATSYTLAKAVAAIGGCDLVLCGKHAIDGDTAQVGPGLAFWLGRVFVTGVRKIRKDESENGFFTVERSMDYGYDLVRLPLPALFTVSDEINEPRLPSLKGRMRAKKAEITRLSASDIGAEKSRIGFAGSPTRVVEIFAPEQIGAGEILSGSLEEQVDQLALRLKPYLQAKG